MALIDAIEKKNFLVNIYEYQSKFNQYINPLFTFTEVKFFQYVRYTKDSFWQGFCSDQKSFHHNIEQEYFVSHFAEDNFEEYQTGFFFLDSLPANEHEKKHITELRDEFNIGNLFLISQKEKDYCDFFILGTDPSLSFNNFYLNNIEMLKKICFIIQNKVANDEVKKLLPKIKIPKSNNLRNPFYEIEEQDLLSVFHMSFLDKYLLSRCDKMKLTVREKDCLQHLLQRYNSKKSASLLNLSPRTIETHVENIKQKFLVKSKKEILNYFEKVNII
ncbi:helix-turn-helix transcriptional regulator [Legionella clemsonensis]|uniref:Bacterial regulatory proteins, luxR family n=1 Tax=Legionella clemsonensis TaxID=1867846 RepID=A0A222P344_9GAMM|nr:LuxR C-terminal-related transcriptional regulator [Legionella clemsonensis]ASQ46195.1 Bacterial regulatory proteins, luxR family [Legionella clemsonensis]